MNAGFILLYRQITEWEWYKNPNTFRVFLHCLLMANFTDGRFEGQDIKRGQFVTSLPSLSKQTSLSIQQVRTALDHLKSTGEITDKAYPKYRVITVVKYNNYQQDNRQNNSQATGNQQASNRLSTGYQQQYNNNNKGINDIDVVDNILSLTPGDIAESIRLDQEIEDAARKVGLTVSESAIMRARDLADKYGHRELIEAIEAAIDVPKWAYVEGILRNEGDELQDKAAASRSKQKTIEIMKRLGKWDDDYGCSKEVADEYRAKGITPEQVRKVVG